MVRERTAPSWRSRSIVVAGILVVALVGFLWWTMPEDTDLHAQASPASTGAEAAGLAGDPGKGPSAGEAKPEMAPDFELEVFGGGKIKLSEALEKGPVLVDFWATWCGPCRRAMPSYQQLYAKYGRQGFQVLAVSQDTPTSQAKIGEFFARSKLEFPALLDGHSKVANRYGVASLPTSFLVAQDGRIVERHTGFVDGDAARLEARIQALLPDAHGFDSDGS
jgi:peroxiredoxin